MSSDKIFQMVRDYYLVHNGLEGSTFVVEDERQAKRGQSGFLIIRDIRADMVHLIWTPPGTGEVPEEQFNEILQSLRKEIQEVSSRYRSFRCYVIPPALEGYTSLRDIAELTIPARFFDKPIIEEALKQRPDVATILAEIRQRTKPLLGNLVQRPAEERVDQPYVELKNWTPHGEGRDLFQVLQETLKRVPQGPEIYLIIGSAGAGKTVLFQALLRDLFDYFQKQKRRGRLFPRPVPLVPEYIRRGVHQPRVADVVVGYVARETAVEVCEGPRTERNNDQVNLKVFEWLLTHGFQMWLLDGLDEIYAGDEEFKDNLLNYITTPYNQARLLIFLRKTLTYRLRDFLDYIVEDPAVRVYELTDWDRDCKRVLAWIRLAGHRPDRVTPEPPRVTDFLTWVEEPPLGEITGLPYYCSLLAEEFKQRGGRLPVFDEFSILEQIISSIVDRERRKGILRDEDFEKGQESLQEWLETVALEAYGQNFEAISEDTVREYAEAVLQEGLDPDHRKDVLTTLLQFPLLDPGPAPGTLRFKHELVAEYLAGRYWLKRLDSDPQGVGQGLGTRTDLSESLVLRFMASKVSHDSRLRNALLRALTGHVSDGRVFANLLQLLLTGSPQERDVLIRYRISVEAQDLSYLCFENKELQGVSFQNCVLRGTIFRRCWLQGSNFEGALMQHTVFENLDSQALVGARFGSLDRFYIIVTDGRVISDLQEMRKWVQRVTNTTPAGPLRCPATLQLYRLFSKYVDPLTGRFRHDVLSSRALKRGVVYPGAPSPDKCVEACQRAGYLMPEDWRHRIPINRSRLDEIVPFLTRWELSEGLRRLLGHLCSSTCPHVKVNSLQAT